MSKIIKILRIKVGRILRFFDRLNDKFMPFLGLGDYDAYLKHLKEHHPDAKPLSKAEFFKNSQDSKAKNVKC